MRTRKAVCRWVCRRCELIRADGIGVAIVPCHIADTTRAIAGQILLPTPDHHVRP